MEETSLVDASISIRKEETRSLPCTIHVFCRGPVVGRGDGIGLESYFNGSRGMHHGFPGVRR